MKKQLLFICGMIATMSLVGQISVEISTSTPMPVCSGLTTSNTAQVEVGEIYSQIQAVPNTRIEYTWTVKHAFGEWTWHNYTAQRQIPIPWPGIYEVQIMVMYFRPGKTYPYVVFSSNPLYLQGENLCAGTGE